MANVAMISKAVHVHNKQVDRTTDATEKTCKITGKQTIMRDWNNESSVLTDRSDEKVMREKMRGWRK